ncbi:MAG: hypothetical protein BWK77_03390 [Verrucomicrobia bacterium A1]|nr:MAG: hypothetical protein BWK77_03390 [Verrucomicrobia bacterium A1]
MKKQDLIVVVALIALWLAWPTVDRLVIRKYFFPHSAAVAAATNAVPAVSGSNVVLDVAGTAPAAIAEAPAAVEEPAMPSVPEKTAVLENARVKVTVSSWGASIVAAELKAYPQSREAGSAPVVLDFSDTRALAYLGVPGFSGFDDFALETERDGRTARFERASPAGVRLRRTITLTDGYQLKITDELSNTGAEAVTLPAQRIQLGAMRDFKGETPTKGMVYLGADTLLPGGEGVKHWGSKIPKWFDAAREQQGLPKIPARIEWPIEKPADWIAVKNKYFAQVLVPEGGGDKARVRATRVISPAEVEDPAFKPRGAVVETVSASLELPELTIRPGESQTRAMQYYAGPKKYSELNQYGQHMVDVMEFGMWAPVGKVLLRILNWIHDVLWPHNYGVAIILLTILVRIVFWPVTRKSTESMKRMQEIQPLVTEVRAKYKDNTQKQQQEIMALYKEHKVNPMGGCLPMLIQIPVFIALYVVLRSAIELRFSPFLWIKDLSQPENLFQGMIPFVGSLNILPIFMAATMAWQQKLTPSAGGDPAQQKMMMFMPVMMLVLFYNIASGLVLYWSTNQVLMITQQLLMQRKKKAAAAATSGG